MSVGVDLHALQTEQKWEEGDKLNVTVGDWTPIRDEEKGKTYEIEFEAISSGSDNHADDVRATCMYLMGKGEHPEYGLCNFSFHDYVIAKVEPVEADPAILDNPDVKEAIREEVKRHEDDLRDLADG